MQAKGTTHWLKPLLVTVILLAGAGAVYPFDHAIANALRTFSHAAGKRHIVQEALSFFRPLGKGEVALLIACALGFCGARRRAARILLSLLIVALLVWPFKLGVGRERPNQSNTQSFPSGDVATIAALCTPLAAAFPWTIPAGAIAIAGVAAGRIYDGNHFPSDVLAGAAFGIFAGGLALAVLRRRDYHPRRAGFLLAGILILVVDFCKLPWARVLPYGLDFLGIWGPVGLFLLVARLGPAVWRSWRLRQHGGTLPRPALLASGVAAILSLYLLLTTASTLWDRDEPRFARATVEMVESGDYLVPTFNGSLRPDKPILIYWLMSGPVRLFGPSELACRMVAPFATIAASLLTLWAGAQIAGMTVGLMAFAMLAFSPLMIVSGTAATTDALLLACITAAICSFLLSWIRGLRPFHVLLLTLALAGALLTKGPVGLAVPLLAIAGILLFVRGGAVRPLTYLPWLALAVAGAVGLFLAWGLPADAATHGEFLRRGLGHHVVDRTVTPLESHGGKSLLFAFYYLPVILFAFFPWTLYLPHLFRARWVWPGTLALPARRVLLCWALPIIVLMSAVATKLPHYVLPAWPALAIAAAIGVLNARREGRQGTLTTAARIGLGIFTAAGLALGLGLIVGPWFMPIFGARVPAVSMGLVFVAMTFAGWHGYVRGRHGSVVGILACGMALVLLTATFRFLPALEPLKISPRVAACVARHVSGRAPVATCGYGEPSLNFYLGRGPIRSLAESELAGWAIEPGEGVLVITAPILDRHHDSLQGERIRALAEIDGFNYSQGKWVKVVILLKGRT